MTTAMRRRALILGASGQDGFYLTRSLQADGWEVIAVVRGNDAVQMLPELDGVTYLSCDLTQPAALMRIIDSVAFDHAYNLAGLSSVKACWSDPRTCHEVNAAVAIQIMSLIHSKILRTGSDIRLFQASSAEMFGCTHTPHSEATPMKPINPYGVAKLAAHREVIHFREEFGHHFVAGIMNCHESPLRPARFVSRRISQGVAAIACGRASELSLGNVAAVRDWGHALDYVLAMRLMLDADTPADYVVSTGVGRSIMDLVDAFAASAGLGNDRAWLAYDHSAARPADIPTLVGDSSRIHLDLEWQPRITFEQLVAEMLNHDLARLRGQPRGTQEFHMFGSL